MKKFEINFYNTWGWGHFDLFKYDAFKARTGTFLEVTIFNFEFDITYRTDKQIKEAKKWAREMEKRAEDWGKVFEPKKKVAKKVAAKKRKTTK